MAKKSQTTNTITLKSENISKEEFVKQKAKAVLRPSLNAASVVKTFAETPFGELDINALADSLVESIDQVGDGDLTRVDAMLLAQAYALQAIFVNLSRRSTSQEYMKNYETFMRLALKAQGQCRMTLETLATIKNPPVVFAKQANIANGPQQVNQTVAGGSFRTYTHERAHAEKSESEPNKLLETDHGERLDSGAQRTASSVDQAMATMGTINGAT